MKPLLTFIILSYLLTPFLFIISHLVRCLNTELESVTLHEVREQFLVAIILAPIAFILLSLHVVFELSYFAINKFFYNIKNIINKISTNIVKDCEEIK